MAQILEVHSLSTKVALFASQEVEVDNKEIVDQHVVSVLWSAQGIHAAHELGIAVGLESMVPAEEALVD